MLTPVNLIIKKKAKNLSFNKNNVSTYSLPTELFNLLAIPWTARSNQSILKEISPEYSLEELTLKL